MSTVVERGLEKLKRNFAGNLIAHEHGRFSIVFTVNGIKCASLLPVGFPLAQPEHFFADKAVDDYCCSMQRCPFDVIPFPAYWYTWRPNGWNPNWHDINTWAQICAERLTTHLQKAVSDEHSSSRL